MRVFGQKPPASFSDRLVFSPHAIFRPRNSGMTMLLTVQPTQSGPPVILTATLSPPIMLPDPGSTCDVVTPPERICWIAGSSGSMASSARTMFMIPPLPGPLAPYSLPSPLAAQSPGYG